MTIQVINGVQFAAYYSLRPTQLAWFLGSGASASAGIPTGYAMITDFKKRLFCHLSGAKLQDVDASDSIWIDRINQFFKARTVLPSAGDPTEYAKAFEAVYPTQELRRSYIEEVIKTGTPAFPHRVLASLLTTRRVPCVFTTNFDPLVETATTITDQLLPPAERVYLTVAAIDNPDRARLALDESRPFLAKLHGDYLSLELKNTTQELKRQDKAMRSVLTRACGRCGLIVVGYSGRDTSVMEALGEACKEPNCFPGGIYWVTPEPEKWLPAVTTFLETASKAGVSCAIVESKTFDELAADIIDSIDLGSVLKDHVYEVRPAPILTVVPAPTHEQRKFPVLQCSAIPVISMPGVARRITLARACTTTEVRALLREATVWAIAVSRRQEVVAFGTDEGLLRALASLGPTLAGEIDLKPEADSWALGLIYDALTRAVCRDRPLFARMRRAGHLVMAARGPKDEPKDAEQARAQQLGPLKQAYSSALFGEVPGHDFPFCEGIELKLELLFDRWWCAFEPFTWVQLPRKEEKAAESEAETEEIPALFRRGDPVGDWRRERWTNRYNPKWAKIVGAWAALLAGDAPISAFGLKKDEGLDAVFELSPVTAWSRPSHDHPYFDR